MRLIKRHGKSLFNDQCLLLLPYMVIVKSDLAKHAGFKKQNKKNKDYYVLNYFLINIFPPSFSSSGIVYAKAFSSLAG